MAYGDEFINANEGRGLLAPLRQFGSGSLPAANLLVQQANADSLENMCLYLNQRTPKGGFIFIPPGRYVIGRPSPLSAIADPMLRAGRAQITRDGDAALSDLIVPACVTLVFAPRAVLVPGGYTQDLANAHRSDAPWLRRSVDGLPSTNFTFPTGEFFKVRIEIQGGIQAPLQQIFDVFMEDTAPGVLRPRPAASSSRATPFEKSTRSGGEPSP